MKKRWSPLNVAFLTMLVTEQYTFIKGMDQQQEGRTGLSLHFSHLALSHCPTVPKINGSGTAPARFFDNYLWANIAFSWTLDK